MCRSPFKSLIYFPALVASERDSHPAWGTMGRVPMKFPSRSKRIAQRTRRLGSAHSWANSMNSHGNTIHGSPESTNAQIGESCRGDELLYQLVSLCRACHQKAHPEHHESFYDIDYAPCTQCRWGDSGISCGKFAVPAYEALQAGGECGPNAYAFAGLK